MGYSSRQRFWRIELPIAVPVIIAGLRIATVTTIGLVTITTFIGLGGLGYLIINSGTGGSSRPRSTSVSRCASLLAVIADVSLELASSAG